MPMSKRKTSSDWEDIEHYHKSSSVFISFKNSDGVQMVTFPTFPSDRRSSSPEMIYLHSASMAQEMNLSSSGSLHMLTPDEGIIILNS